MWYNTPKFSQRDLVHNMEMYNWCKEHFVHGQWGFVSGVDTISYSFAKKEDYVHFMMVWYGHNGT